MSNYKTHIIGGLILSLLAIMLFFTYLDIPLISYPIFFIIIYFFSILPDIDHKNSKITWNLLGIGGFLIVIGLIDLIIKNIFPINTLFFGISLILIILLFARTKHRGVTHTMWFITFAPLTLLLIPNLPSKALMVLIAIISGYSHLLLDGYFFKLSLSPKKGRW